MAPAELRTKLLGCVKHGRNVLVLSQRNGEACSARGRVVSVNLTHFVLSWRTGEMVIPINAVTSVEDAGRDDE
jgi:hypothetical protein